MRTTIEALADRVLLLYAVDRGNTYGCMDGPFKLMKIPLMAELESVEHGINTFNYTFFRFNHGPMTTEIYEDASQLRSAGLLDAPEKGKGYIRLTEEGERLLEEMSDLFRDNEQICQYVEKSAKKYAQLDFYSLKRVVYEHDVVICGTKMKIAEVPRFCGVITKLSGENVSAFQMNDDWIDTLWGELNYTQEEKAKALKIVRSMRAYA